MADFLASSQQFSVTSGCDWLADVRQQGQAIWQNFALPTRKTEDWKYTPLSCFKQRDFFNAATETAQVPAESLAELFAIDGLNAAKLVFVNGKYCADLSSLPSIEGVQLARFQDANSEQQAAILAKLNSVVDISQHGFAGLNSQLLSEGVYLHVAANTVVAQPVHVVSLTTGSQADFNVNARALVVLEANASATIVEHFSSTVEQQTNFTNSITELDIADNASLVHYRLHEEQEHAQHIGGVHAALGRHARLNSFYLAYGSTLKRIDVSVNYRGEGAEAIVNGVYLPKNKQHVDFHTCIEHAVPHCNTSETFRGIVADEARAVFAGRIHIHKDAQKTEAYLSNKNLLTSNKAEVDTKPELEIYADDVRCAHGATVAQLDPMSVHYLKTRGVSEEEALVMLSFGFINELLSNVKHEAITQYCRPKLATLFARDPELARHLL